MIKQASKIGSGKLMKLISSIFELGIVGVFSIMLLGYALFVYPFELINQKVNPQARRRQQLKYASQN